MQKTQATRPFSEIDGPRGRPFVGLAPDFLRDPISVLTEGFERYGDLVAYPFGPRRGPLRNVVVAAYHPDAVQFVLTETERTIGRGPSSTRVLGEMIGSNLMTTDGPEWRRQRRTLQPLFTPRRVAHYTELMHREAERIATEDVPGPGSEVDLHLLMLRYSLRMVGAALFSSNIDHIGPELHQLIPLTNDLIIARTTTPVRLPLGVPTRSNRRFERVHRQLYSLIDRIIAQRDGHPADEERDDILTRLRTARDPETGDGLSSQEIRDQTLLMMMAGHETTATALTFALHQLGRYQDIQDAVAGDGTDGTDGAGGTDPVSVVDHAQRRDTLTRATLLETMRLHPPVYMTEHAATEDIELGGHHIPAGTALFLSPWVTHRHPDFWPDAERFDPTRFLGAQDRHRYAYLPFGGGPHVCIGEHFALLAATVLLSTLLRHYRITVSSSEIAIQQTGNLRPDEPVLATLHPR
ncbi:cytochrome P450 [Saccharomonospora azurea]|uniref:cytochrome P450 n=1 Tax=Saccharomonospora azurea TaxID=40988 RepID=UPI003323C60C